MTRDGRQYGCCHFCNDVSDWLINRNYVIEILGTSGGIRAKTQNQNGEDPFDLKTRTETRQIYAEVVLCENPRYAVSIEYHS